MGNRSLFPVVAVPLAFFGTFFRIERKYCPPQGGSPTVRAGVGASSPGKGSLPHPEEETKEKLTMNIAMITDILEALTIFCFGLSWPISIRKSIISRTAKGKSLFFEVFLLIGYACGIARKIIQVSAGSSGFIFFLSFFFYVLNFVEISIDVGLYFRNKKLDELADSQNA